MTQRVLPVQLTRTMLSPVSGSRHFPGSSKLSRRALCSLLSLGVLGSPAAALAQAADSGWFDPPPAGGAPDPYYAAPETEAEPQPEPEPEVPDNDPSALTTFRPALDPYGNWVNDSTYGTVWVPHAHVVGSDFAPYVSRGHWALTADDDWIWVSDYPFGWAVFHYGRWVWISGYGWSWVPGRTYANAWVVWRVPTAEYAYIGWAPMPPSWAWHGGVAVGLWYAPPLPYVFCHTSFVFHRHVHHHIVHDRHLVHRIAARTRVYPTTYHSPARPGVRPTASSPRRAAPPASAAPRGPRLAAARVPPSAVPRERAAPPANAARLSGARRMTSARDLPTQRAVAPQTRSSAAAQRLPAESRRPVTSEPVRRSTPSSTTPASTKPPPSASSDRSPRATDRMRSSPDRARSSAPRVRNTEPRSVAPVRSRPVLRDATPAPAPVRSRRRP